MLAPAERYTTIGVRSGKTRTPRFLLTAAEFKQPKREEETLLFSFVNFGQRRRRKGARVSVLSHKTSAVTHNLCAFFTRP